MGKINYSLDAWIEDEGNKLFEWLDLESLPRFEVGDHFSSFMFDPQAETGARHVVVDAKYSLTPTGGPKGISLSLHLRPESDFEKSAREENYRAGFRPE